MDVENNKPSCMVCRNESWCSHCGVHCGAATVRSFPNLSSCFHPYLPLKNNHQSYSAQVEVRKSHSSVQNPPVTSHSLSSESQTPYAVPKIIHDLAPCLTLLPLTLFFDPSTPATLGALLFLGLSRKSLAFRDFVGSCWISLQYSSGSVPFRFSHLLWELPWQPYWKTVKPNFSNPFLLFLHHSIFFCAHLNILPLFIEK